MTNRMQDPATVYIRHNVAPGFKLAKAPKERERMGVTLKAVKSGGPLTQSLEKKMQEVSDKLSKATIDLVALQEKLMLARIRFQDGVAELSLEKDSDKPPSSPASTAPATTKI